MFFGHFVKFQDQNVKVYFRGSHALKQFMSRSQNTIHFEYVLRISRDMAIWNFCNSALWIHFLGQGHWHHFDFFVLPRRGLPSHQKSSSEHLELISLHPHMHTRAHHPITARAIYSSCFKNKVNQHFRPPKNKKSTPKILKSRENITETKVQIECVQESAMMNPRGNQYGLIRAPPPQKKTFQFISIFKNKTYKAAKIYFDSTQH